MFFMRRLRFNFVFVCFQASNPQMEPLLTDIKVCVPLLVFLDQIFFQDGADRGTSILSKVLSCLALSRIGLLEEVKSISFCRT
jgi:hypothetical protein